MYKLEFSVKNLQVPAWGTMLGGMGPTAAARKLASFTTRLASILLLIAISAPRGFAARPLVTDDSRVTGKDGFQLETWVGADSESVHHWAVLSYDPLDWLEISAGALHGISQENYSVGFPLVQTKWVFATPVENGFPGVALAVGAMFNFGFGPLKFDQIGPFGYLAFTEALWDSAVQVHFNLGFASERGLVWPTAALGSDFKIWKQFRGLAEIVSDDAFTEEREGKIIQVGLRFTWSDQIQLDGSIGTGTKTFDAFPGRGSVLLRWTF